MRPAIKSVAVVVAIMFLGTAAMAGTTLKPAIGIIGKGGMVLVKAPREKSESPAYSLTGKPVKETRAKNLPRNNSVHH